MFKKVKDQIANQTRENLGSIKMDNVNGSINKKQLVTPTNIPTDEPVEFQKWHKVSYYMNRAGSEFVIPCLVAETFHNENPGFRKPSDYYRFSEVAQSPEYALHTDTIQQTQENGSFLVKNLPSLENASYVYNLAGNGKKESITLQLGSNKISYSVWAITNNSDENGFNYETVLLGHSGISGLVDSWASIQVPIGVLGTRLYILTYNHGDNPHVFSCSKPSTSGRQVCYTSMIGDGLGSVTTDTFLNVVMDVYAKTSASTPDYSKYKSPGWATITPITTTADPITGNIINKLSFDNSDFYGDESKIEVFRREIFNDLTIETTIDSKMQPNLIVLSTADMNGFEGNFVFKVNGKYQKSMGAMLSQANTVDNSDFQDYTNTRPDSWTYAHTATGAMAYGRFATVHPYYGDSEFGGSCLKMSSFLTDTTESQYVETGYLLSNTAESVSNGVFSFYHLRTSQLPLARVKAMYYSSNDGTLSTELDSASVLVRDYSHFVPGRGETDSWQLTMINTTSLSMRAPVDSLYTKFRIYNTYGDTSASTYYIDGVHYGEMNADHTYHTSVSNKLVLQLADGFTKARNSNTIVNSWFQSTTESITNSIYASSVYGQPYYIDNTGWGTAVGFDRAVGFFATSRTYTGNGDFSGGLHYWTTAGGLAVSTVDGQSLFDNDYFMRINNVGSTSVGYFYNVNGGNPITYPVTINSTWWLKSEFSGAQVVLKNLYSDLSRIDSALVTITDEWKQYSLKSSFTTAISHTFGAISLPANSGQVDLCGYMTGPNEFNEFVNINDTSAASSGGDLFAQQGIKYSTALNSSYGTVRMWYTPMLNETTGNPFNALFFWGDATNYKSLFYNKHSRSFIFRQKSGASYKYCEVGTATGENSAIHVVASWHSTATNLFINNKKSVSTATYTNVTSTAFTVGYGAPSLSSSYSANGFISNFRVDESTWNADEVNKDYNAQYLTFLDGATVEAYSETFIGEKTISGNDKDFNFIDDVGLEPNTTYNYVFKVGDGSGNTTILSTPASITTSRRPFEKTSKNKVRNASFEVSEGVHGQPIYWSTGNSLKTECEVSTAFYFKNTRSIKMGGGGGNYPTYDQDYISITDTTVPLAISWYSYTPYTYPVERVTLGWYDKNLTLISTIAGYGKGGSLSSAISQTGLDGNSWTRYSTIIPVSSASYLSSKYMSLGFNNNSPQEGYLDAVQVEHNSTVTPFDESPFLQDGNFGPNSIDGNAISFDTLMGKHFQAGEININSPDADGNRLTIGYATAGANFMRFTPNRAIYHQQNTSTTEGYHFAKHVESGVGWFDTTIVFDAPFQIWNSTSANQLQPHYFIVPKKYKTYDSAYPSNHQEVSITVTFDSAAASMYVNAYLQNGQGYMTQDLVGFVRDNGSTETLYETITSESSIAADIPLY